MVKECNPTVSANSQMTIGGLLGDKATNNENTHHTLVIGPPCVS